MKFKQSGAAKREERMIRNRICDAMHMYLVPYCRPTLGATFDVLNTIIYIVHTVRGCNRRVKDVLTSDSNMIMQCMINHEYGHISYMYRVQTGDIREETKP